MSLPARVSLTSSENERGSGQSQLVRSHFQSPTCGSLQNRLRNMSHENREAMWRRLKIPTRIMKNQNRQDPLNHTEEKAESLEESSRRLILREEQLFAQQTSSGEEEAQLHRDLEVLRDLMGTAIQDPFTCSSAEQREVLRSAVTAIQQQEEQDLWWAELPKGPQGPGGRVPTWRPLKFLRTHNLLLENLVESRLMMVCEDQTLGQELSSAVKNQVCRWGRCVKNDLLKAARTLVACYPPHLDILDVLVHLYHQRLSVHLKALSQQNLQPEDRRYLLLWVNHLYAREVMQQEELHLKTSGLGPLLQEEQLKLLEEQHLSSSEYQVKLWLDKLLNRERQAWRDGAQPEVLDGYCFSPLAIDVIQVLDASLSEFSCVIRNQSETRRLTVHLEEFLSRYSVCVQDLVQWSLGNVDSVIKAQLVCEQQLRRYVAESQRLSEEEKRRCSAHLSVVRHSGYWRLTCPVQAQLKERLRPLWTPAWVDESLPVISDLLEFVNKNVCDLCDLSAASREEVLSMLHQDVVLQYVKKTLKMKTSEQQVGGASRMIQDARMIDGFFRDEGEDSWLCSILCNLAEFLRLQDPESIKGAVLTLRDRYPDLSDVHVSALLSLKPFLSSADLRSIRRNLDETRLPEVSTNHSPPFFSRLKIKGIRFKLRHMTR
ncbi:unnamed protein product [Ophioblennius macclurei]